MSDAPAIILVVPQLGENIGATARAMANFGLSDLRLVRPRDGWPNPDAIPMSAGATDILDSATVHATTEDAIADLHYVVATTARHRDMIKPVLTSHETGVELRQRAGRSENVGILFGGERSGLDNDDIVLADALTTIPTSPDFSSINIAQAVLLTGYEWFAGEHTGQPDEAVTERTRPANKHELIGMIEHMEKALDEAGFFYPPERRPTIIRSVRNIWQRADLREQDVRTLRGIIVALSSGKRRTTPDE